MAEATGGHNLCSSLYASAMRADMVIGTDRNLIRFTRSLFAVIAILWHVTCRDHIVCDFSFRLSVRFEMSPFPLLLFQFIISYDESTTVKFLPDGIR